ncbi:hypothetical protein ALP74_200529 [Pseudomonas coronafaciens pv. garcae]|uniref:Uncharacterized protein n=1 Tax=Pseudomonas coronafaciens pv. garcae TaxID=251653 RepID=A0AB37QT20_9PSED|nr:hypothetical protein ALP74_200529 [Pseudomonas coronafaciens pv. garcae]
MDLSPVLPVPIRKPSCSLVNTIKPRFYDTALASTTEQYEPEKRCDKLEAIQQRRLQIGTFFEVIICSILFSYTATRCFMK